MKKIAIILMILLVTPIFSKTDSEGGIKQIAVFIPGVMAGSPIYEDLDAGVRQAAEEHGLGVKTIEGGFDAASWPEKIKEISATGMYDLIVSSNPSMPQIMLEVSESFPTQKFLCLDGNIEGSKNIYTAEYKQFDQAYMAGYLAGLITLSKLEGANPDKKVGLIVAYHYPVLDNVLIPGFKKGLADVDKDITVDLRVVGNWWDATKASELTSIMINEGVDVFLSISGGATQGVISKAQDMGKYIIHFDSNGYNKAPGTILGSTVIKQKQLTYKLVTDFINGDLIFGNADQFSARDGYIDFIQDDPLYQKYVPQDIKDKMSKVVENIKK
ncbi:BMP family ABC transporter substrate-binding protein [Thiospirochaeta perfilievii]|uniref:BMP family ABC transporter substrate-binding protein n=1 Tax=Thiospirochaeta perfilievii TaxID=252967 RepID=A0A5C1QDG8_9SPIO|nr:BMP family ABC transporter substrate-binding protein [Thiospirochaeta perfilievii]QEN05029.1 BMP family ABC transporter substrate-binding protein [Thiospirochaeta perfilievii]